MTRLILFGKPEASDYLQSVPTDPIDTDTWDKYRRNALRYLKASGEPPGTIATLELLPFSCEWTVDSDPFEGSFRTSEQLLILRVPVEVFVEIEQSKGNWNQRVAVGIPDVIWALNRVGCNIRGAVAEMELDAENSPIALLEFEDLHITSDTVEDALRQARTLILSHGAPAALDRVHTVFHAYLREACQKIGVTLPSDKPGIIHLLGLLWKHEAFHVEPEIESLLTQTLRGIQKAADALEGFRNNHSLAHPQEMLPEPEALFVINLTQAMLRYLDARLS